MNKRNLSERDICTKFITPALTRAHWDLLSQIREEVSFTKGRVIVRGQLSTRGEPKRADYLLYLKPGIPLAVLEAKDNKHAVGAGMQQALDYAVTLDLPFAFSCNGDAFLFHDRTGQSVPVEQEIPLNAFPSPADLWRRYCAWKAFTRQGKGWPRQTWPDQASCQAAFDRRIETEILDTNTDILAAPESPLTTLLFRYSNGERLWKLLNAAAGNDPAKWAKLLTPFADFWEGGGCTVSDKERLAYLPQSAAKHACGLLHHANIQSWPSRPAQAAKAFCEWYEENRNQG